MRYILVSEKIIHHELVENLNARQGEEWILINRKEDFTADVLKKIGPSKVFVPHWSYIIPENIYTEFEVIVFHMTDLPFGRGGSPLQNLIVRGYKETKISALRVVKEIDAGDIYLKKPLQLSGTAHEILVSASGIIEKMITEIIDHHLAAVPQEGEPYVFQRRKPSESDISQLTSIEDVFNYIRMLDADGYPKAFLENSSFRFEFTEARLESDNNIINAHVRIFKK